MKKHTPMPWVARKCGSGWAIDFNEDQEQVVDHVYEEADAYLIAAAPDLLEAAELALREAEGCIHDQLDGTKGLASALAALQPVRDAIAKARGES